MKFDLTNYGDYEDKDYGDKNYWSGWGEGYITCCGYGVCATKNSEITKTTNTILANQSQLLTNSL